MPGYTEGKHDDPADTQDRLVRIGAKYQATAPAVADGDKRLPARRPPPVESSSPARCPATPSPWATRSPSVGT